MCPFVVEERERKKLQPAENEYKKKIFFTAGKNPFCAFLQKIYKLQHTLWIINLPKIHYDDRSLFHLLEFIAKMYTAELLKKGLC